MDSYKDLTMHGLDVSHWQGAIDYKSYYAAGGRFVIVKHAGANIGRMYEASKRDVHREAARKAGLKIGYYYVANGYLDPLEQAKFFVKSVKKVIQSGDIVCLDNENLDKGIAFNAEQAMVWLDYVAAHLDVVPFYYSYPALMRRHQLDEVAKKYPLWLAAFNKNNGTTQGGFERHMVHWDKPSIWQYTSTGRVSGYAGNLDFNVALPDVFEKYGHKTEQDKVEVDKVSVPADVVNAVDKGDITLTWEDRVAILRLIGLGELVDNLASVPESKPEPKPEPAPTPKPDKPEPKPEPVEEDKNAVQYPFPQPLPRISSKYGYRTHPISGKRKKHNGTDFAAASGTPIEAIADGVVVKSKKSGHPTGGYGQFIQIDHGDGVHSLYAHMLTGSRKVSKGDKVSKGQVIGKVGSTGYSTGPHLHFEIRVNGRFVDPMKYIKKNGEAIVGQTPDTTKTHTVKSGDTLWAIALRYGTTVPSLRKMNNISGSLIVPGQVLTVRK